MQLRAIPFLVLATALLASVPADAAKCPRGTLTGSVTHVRDGDTIVVGSMPIRLNGLAAPEGDEPGGATATRAMVELVEGRTLRCELDGERNHDRCVGICYLEGEDISEVMVQRGLARDCPRFSRGRYADAERQAAAEGATIGGTYALPGQAAFDHVPAAERRNAYAAAMAIGLAWSTQWHDRTGRSPSWPGLCLTRARCSGRTCLSLRLPGR